MFDKLKQKILHKDKDKDTDTDTNKNKGKDTNQTPFESPHMENLSLNDSISTAQLYQSRAFHGVNFGGLFLLEKWLYPSMFPDETNGTEYEFDAIAAIASKKGVSEAVKMLEDHYAKFLNNNNEYEWLEQHGIDSVRIPVGYWHVSGGDEKYEMKGMKFAQVKEVYQQYDPLTKLKEVVKNLQDHNIGCIIDIHGLPGSANGQHHNGEEKDNKGGFFGSNFEKYEKYIVDHCIPVLAKEFASFENVIGLQVINENEFVNKDDDRKKFSHVTQYYKDCLHKLRSLNVSWPLIISDGWWCGQWDEWVTKENLQLDVIIDTHCYRCFSDADKSQKVQDIVAKFQCLDSQCSNDFIVGEFSCVVDGASWSLSNANRDEWVKNYGLKQVDTFNQSENIAGWFFWTFKFEYGDGGEWGLKPMMDKGCIKGAPNNSNKKDIDSSMLDRFYKEHASYWDQHPSSDYEHFRFKDGLEQAVADIKMFHNFNGSSLGRVNYWVTSRKTQYCEKQKISPNHKSLWEYEHGYKKAIQEFNN
ncbi:hypothetical protein ACO0RG_000538 [Hanseniaspora osmophila]|uniref:Putative glycosyl hydrolase n=1 Tax=Hanseniaspora osmophila TaxID=56408 RepID=A0A1E5R1U1_9ASCO